MSNKIRVSDSLLDKIFREAPEGATHCSPMGQVFYKCVYPYWFKKSTPKSKWTEIDLSCALNDVRKLEDLRLILELRKEVQILKGEGK